MMHETDIRDSPAHAAGVAPIRIARLRFRSQRYISIAPVFSDPALSGEVAS
jgi:hypothetical protein